MQTESKFYVDSESRLKNILYICGWFGNFLITNAFLTMLVYRYDPGWPNDNNFPILVPSVIVGVVVLTGRMLGAFSQPLIGYASDRLSTPWGKRKPFLAGSIIPLVLSFFFLFNPPMAFSQVGYMIYLALMLILFNVGMSTYHVTYLSWLSVLAPRPDERIKLSTQLGICGLIGASIGGVLAPWIVQTYGFKTMGFTVSLISLITLSMPIFMEDAEASDQFDGKHKFPGFWVSLKAAWQNRSFRVYIVTLASGWVALSIFMNCLTFLTTALLRQEVGFAGILNGIIVGGAIGGFVFIIPLTKRFGKKRVLRISMLWFGCGLIAIGIWPILVGSLLPAWLILLIASSLVLSGFFSLPNAMLSDIVDADAQENGVRRGAIFFGIRGVLVQISQGLGVLMAGIVLMLGKTASQPMGVQLVFGIAGCFALLAAWVCKDYAIRQ